MNRQHASLAAALGAFSLAGLVLFAPLPAAHSAAAPAQAGRFQGTVQACAYEDSPGFCVWDATRSGNHLGRSFIRDARGGLWYRHETRAESGCKDAAAEGAPARVGPRSRACERAADRLAR